MGASLVSPRRVTAVSPIIIHCRVTWLEQNIGETGVSAVTLQERSLPDAKLEMLFLARSDQDKRL